MLRQIQWGVQNVTVIKNKVLPVTTTQTSTNHPNVQIHAFRKRWSFI